MLISPKISLTLARIWEKGKKNKTMTCVNLLLKIVEEIGLMLGTFSGHYYKP